MSSAIKFVVDAMLGTLAKKLRIYGFDTIYARDMEDTRLVEFAISESRILVTSDRALGAVCNSRGALCIVPMGKDDSERMAAIFRFISRRPSLDPLNSRCPVCNGELAEVDSNKVNDMIPRATARRYTKFFMCKECKKIYWEGNHWSKLREFDKKMRGYLE